MKLSAVVAVDKNYGIGKDGGLLFSIPEDMKFFREKTRGGVVVMGRSTFESFPNGPLKNRVNIVLSKSAAFEGTVACQSIEELFAILPGYADKEIFVIGGEAIYSALIDYCDTAFVTEVSEEAEADRFFPRLSEREGWRLAERSEEKCDNGHAFTFCRYENDRVLKF